MIHVDPSFICFFCVFNHFNLCVSDGSGVCLQVLLVLVALVAVPIMLLPKPLILKKRFEKRQADLAQYGRIARHDMDEEGAGLRVAAAHSEEEEEFDFGEIMVHQVSCPVFPLFLPCMKGQRLCLHTEMSFDCPF
jgi:hypothetical protein